MKNNNHSIQKLKSYRVSVEDKLFKKKNYYS